MSNIGPPSATEDSKPLSKRPQQQACTSRRVVKRAGARGAGARRALLATLLVLAAPACASMQQRVTESENRSATLEAQVADLQATQQQIITRLTQLREDLETGLDPVRAQQASSGVDLQSLETQVAALQQQIVLLTEQLARLEAAGTTTTGAARQPTMAMPPAGGGQVTQDPGAAAAGSEQDALFDAAYGDYTAGQYVLAISGFEEFLARYPNAPRGADAVYWIGESLAAQEMHDDARRRFLEIAQRYPTSAKVPDAILRAALEAVELGQLDDAIRELRQLIAAYQESDAALIGCMQLERMGQPLPAGCNIFSR
jgi:tol-pal system protein YbgF